MKPNFLVIGAAKAGTTWLYSCLEEHPEVFVSKVKEIHFFSRQLIFDKGFNWYESHFDSAVAEKAIGEVSPSYLFREESPERIYRYNPNIKLIVILRNPVDRAYSNYCMRMRTGKVDRDIEKGLSLDSPSATAGLYYQQISRFTKLFPQEQIKIVFFEDIKQNPSSLMREVYSFLNVDSSFIPESMYQKKNQGRSMPKYPLLYKNLRTIYESITKKSQLMDRMLTQLRFSGYLEFFHKINKGRGLPQLSPGKKQSLITFYQDDVEQLSNFVKRDLSHWLISHPSNKVSSSSK